MNRIYGDNDSIDIGEMGSLVNTNLIAKSSASVNMTFTA